MSKERIEKVKCPKCQKESDFVVWESINTMLDPDMKEKVLNSQAFVFECPHCGTKTLINYSTLYHQMEDRIMIYLVYGEDKSQAEEYMKGIYKDSNGDPLDTSDIDLDLTAGYKNRVVETYNQLKEKILIFDAGLDDHVIEIMKLYMIANFKKNDPNLNIYEMLFNINDKGEKYFSVNLDGDRFASTEFPDNLYAAMSKDFMSKINKDREVSINMEWAANFLHSNLNNNS